MAKKPTSRRTKEPTLPDSELEVIRVLWERQRATARQVLDTLRQRGSRWTYATINTLLQRLETKGLTASDKSRLAYVYCPRISRQQVIKKRVRQLVDKLYDGQGGPLVMHLLKSQRLSPKEISEIHELLSGGREHDDA